MLHDPHLRDLGGAPPPLKRIEREESHLLGRRLVAAALSDGVAAASVCAFCHGRAADTANYPCFHKWLCAPCTAGFRARHGPVCPTCRQPSRLLRPPRASGEEVAARRAGVALEALQAARPLPPLPPPPANVRESSADRGHRLLQAGLDGLALSSGNVLVARAPRSTQTCAVCWEDWDSAHTFVAGPCFHALCVGCIVTAVRTALGAAGAWTVADAAGVRCAMPGCATRMDVATLRALVRVSHAVLPTKEAPIAPLTRHEMDRLEAFLQEAAIPPERKAQCPNVPACGRVLDVPPSATPAPYACPFCDARLCRKCKRAHHPGSRSCAAAAAAARDREPASRALIEATTKACPTCGFRVSHYHGHACHHILPGSPGGCPQCHTHFCYACLSTDERHYCAFVGMRTSWSSNCKASDIQKNLVKAQRFPYDKRCGCPICPDCRPPRTRGGRGRPCAHCHGSCVVCRGIVPPGKMRETEGLLRGPGDPAMAAAAKRAAKRATLTKLGNACHRGDAAAVQRQLGPARQLNIDLSARVFDAGGSIAETVHSAAFTAATLAAKENRYDVLRVLADRDVPGAMQAMQLQLGVACLNAHKLAIGVAQGRVHGLAARVDPNARIYGIASTGPNYATRRYVTLGGTMTAAEVGAEGGYLDVLPVLAAAGSDDAAQLMLGAAVQIDNADWTRDALAAGADATSASFLRGRRLTLVVGGRGQTAASLARWHGPGRVATRALAVLAGAGSEAAMRYVLQEGVEVIKHGRRGGKKRKTLWLDLDADPRPTAAFTGACLRWQAGGKDPARARKARKRSFLGMSTLGLDRMPCDDVLRVVPGQTTPVFARSGEPLVGSGWAADRCLSVLARPGAARASLDLEMENVADRDMLLNTLRHCDSFYNWGHKYPARLPRYPYPEVG